MQKFYIKHSESQTIIVAVEAHSEEEALKRFDEWMDCDESLWNLIGMVDVQANNEIMVDPSGVVTDRELSDTEYQKLHLPVRVHEAEKCLVDNGIAKDEAKTVLQALGYILMDKDLY